ncbi:MAG TPA: DUF5010 domain-containing protein [Polyangia bacterium]
MLAAGCVFASAVGACSANHAYMDGGGPGGRTSDPAPGTGGRTGRGGSGGSATSGAGGSDAGVIAPAGPGAYGQSPFVLREEWNGPCAMAATVDLTRGNSNEAFVRAAHCQIKGSEAAPALVTEWATKLRTLQYVRRIDVANTFCAEAARSCKFSHSDPWLEHPTLDAACKPATQRQLGAVLMIWSNCPGKTNCRMDWANTHALGMERPHKLYGFEGKADGYYVAENPGWWRRELLDARYAGLSFVLPNVYGDELAEQPGRIGAMVTALNAIGEGVKVGLFDDTWGWGNPDFPAPFNKAPDLEDRETAAMTLYTAKWQPYFRRVPRKHWFLYNGKPFIYFYNAGTLKPAEVAAGVLKRMKEMFAKEFGVEPFVAVDHAYFADDTMGTVADARFRWSTFALPTQRSRETLKGVTLEHFMVRWDDLARDEAPGRIAKPDDRLWKGPEMLEKALAASRDAQLAVIATWNDLGEGTGVGRNYDYAFRDGLQPPDAFINLIRRAQCSE